MDEVTVTDADREAAATHSFADTPPETRWLQAGIREGEWDRCELVQAFARHREQSIAPYREALEKIETTALGNVCRLLARIALQGAK